MKADKTAEIEHETHFGRDRFHESLLEAVTKNLRIHEKITLRVYNGR